MRDQSLLLLEKLDLLNLDDEAATCERLHEIGLVGAKLQNATFITTHCYKSVFVMFRLRH
ncbi:Rop family plasmid primer RNA-binding protein [Enterobacter sp. 166D1]|uniref:Rop family plasmid primer RNA-binding protein n=1 Tax=Enterobacter TaxID=547 RepID=UPI002A7F1D01|nr:Rop family plasmid primer RNA-binding protein [Enterobacter sp. 166D1]